jgi:hypothetical protein
MKHRPPARRSRPPLHALVLALLVGAGLLAGAPAASDDGSDGSVVIEVVLDDRAALDRLVDSGADLAHELDFRDGRIVAQVVTDPAGIAALETDGYTLGQTLWSEAVTDARIAERDATIARLKAGARKPAAFRETFAALNTDVLTVLRVDYFTTGETAQRLSVEVKSSMGTTSSATSPVITVEWDSGPGTAIGSGGSTTLSRFTDAGVYMYNYREFSVATRPSYVRFSSSAGGEATAAVQDWLPIDDKGNRRDPYEKSFVHAYLTPQELYERIELLHESYPSLTEIVELPFLTNGYQRKAMASMAGLSDIGATPATSQGGTAAAVYLETHAWGHEGGNDVQAEFVDPGAADSPLGVTTTGNRVTVSLGTDSAGATTSTAAQVVAAVNAHPGAAALLTARTYGGNAGGGVVRPRALVNLSDFLAAPASVERGPHTVKLLRIGKHRDGSKTGVFIYAQEHAREWVPPQVTIETAERLLRNYGRDGRTRQLVDNLDIFILPSVNPDGGTYSFYDRGGQRRNMTRHCLVTATNGMPASRGSWGLDVNRNYDEYSLFDGYSGASTSCTNDTYAGPFELSDPEARNVDWVAETFGNLKYSMNTHSSGNYFMWSPGAYRVPGRILAPRPDLGTESYFWAASSHILTEIKKQRNTAVTPARTGPVADVLYSAAGNSGDMMWYKHGLFAWNFETGTAGFQPSFAGGEGSEAWHQMMEFSNGMIGLLDVAYAYTNDRQPPETRLVTERAADGSIRARFTTSEPATIFYTLDGSRPGPASAKYASTGDREPPETLTLATGTTVSWYSVDLAGHTENNYDPDTNGSNYNRTTVK